MKNPGRNQILVFLGIALTAFITLIVQEPLRIWINSYLFAKSVSYVVTSFHVEVNRNELLDLAKTEGIDFNFSLDDPFLRQYSLVTAKLTNEGPAIVDPVRFLVSTGNSRTKLLDIRYRVDSPDNKIVPMEHTVLPLTWDMDVARESKASLNLIADYPDQVEGLILYGSSTSETVGYGRINERLISGLTVTLPHRQEIYSPFFYAVSALTCGGESPLSTEGLQYPALLALQPFFKDVVWIDSSAPSTNSPDGSLNAPFRSFSEAKSTEAKTFIIKQRSQVVNEQADDLNGVQLLSMDDLDFLKGRAEITFPSGLDEEAEIHLYFLFKSLDDVDPNGFSLSLQGSPDVEFRTITQESVQTAPSENDPGNVQNLRLSLTPSKVTAFAEGSTVYLLWEKPINPDYDGVRIFRKESTSALTSLGGEIYDGPVESASLVCRCESSSSYSGTWSLLEPPPRENEVPRLPAPTGLKVFTQLDFGKRSNSEFLFADPNLSLGRSYTYTVFVYDDETYSYSITVTISADDSPLLSDCSLTERGT